MGAGEGREHLLHFSQSETSIISHVHLPFSCILLLILCCFRLYLIFHFHDYHDFFPFVLIPLATDGVIVPCRQALLPISAAEWYVWFVSNKLLTCLLNLPITLEIITGYACRCSRNVVKWLTARTRLFNCSAQYIFQCSIYSLVPHWVLLPGSLSVRCLHGPMHDTFCCCWLALSISDAALWSRQVARHARLWLAALATGAPGHKPL